MKQFLISAKVVVSVYTRVEAETLEEAIEIAQERELMGIAQTGCDTEEDTWLCDELDGMPENISLA